jgi:hypothetical protein
MDMYDLAEQISTKQQFVDFLKLLSNDFENNPDSWENNNLASYLDALYGYCYDTVEKDQLTWAEIANILLAAKVYE